MSDAGKVIMEQAIEIATLNARLEAMTAARDGWRDEAQTYSDGHAVGCKTRWPEVTGRGPCNCPATLDNEAARD